MHAATRAGALIPAGREALLRHVLRPPVAQERLEQRPDGLVRITLKKAYTDGAIAVDMAPLSLLCRLARPWAETRWRSGGCYGVGRTTERWGLRAARDRRGGAPRRCGLTAELPLYYLRSAPNAVPNTLSAAEGAYARFCPLAEWDAVPLMSLFHQPLLARLIPGRH